MINLNNIKNQKFSKTKTVELLFYTFPVSFIIGNFALSLHLLLFIVISLFLIKNEKLDFRFKNYYWILITFFSFLFLWTTIQYLSPGILNTRMSQWSFEANPIFKSSILVRFLILIFIVDTLFYNKILDLKKFFLFSFICSSFVSFDVIFQYIFGFDIFGYEAGYDRHGGPFGNEWIAGSYLQKISFLSFFYIYQISKNKNFNILLLIFIIAFHASAIAIAGSRMPLALFLFGCFLLFLIQKNMRFALAAGIIIFLSIFLIITKNDPKIGKPYAHFISDINILKILKDKNINETSDEKNEMEADDPFYYLKIKKNISLNNLLGSSGYSAIYGTSIRLWKDRPLFGHGLKSLRIKCWEILNEEPRIRNNDELEFQGLDFACANHSHNYYLELLSESGLVGTVLMIIFFVILLKKSFYFIKEYNKKTDNSLYFAIPLIIVIFVEMWPLRSSGSFFTTWNATFFWLYVAILLSNEKKKIN